MKNQSKFLIASAALTLSLLAACSSNKAKDDAAMNTVPASGATAPVASNANLGASSSGMGK